MFILDETCCPFVRDVAYFYFSMFRSNNRIQALLESQRFRAMVDAGSSIEHLAVSSNDIGDEGWGNQGSFWRAGRVREIKLKYAEIMKYWIYGNERYYYMLLC